MRARPYATAGGFYQGDCVKVSNEERGYVIEQSHLGDALVVVELDGGPKVHVPYTLLTRIDEFDG